MTQQADNSAMDYKIVEKTDAPLNYTVVVNGSIYGSQSARSAYLFCMAILERGHNLISVFFYQDGVHNASSITYPANDEFDLHQAWQQLASKHTVRLESCVAASLRRGIVDHAEVARLNPTQVAIQKDPQTIASKTTTANLADGFELAGLGSLAEAMLLQDRVIQF